MYDDYFSLSFLCCNNYANIQVPSLYNIIYGAFVVVVVVVLLVVVVVVLVLVLVVVVALVVEVVVVVDLKKPVFAV